MTLADKKKLILNLVKASCYSHKVSSVEIVETHISWVILTGKYAYKIKKPHDYEFYKAKSLKERINLCKEEIRINKRLSPSLYIDVVEILGTEKTPTISLDNQRIDTNKVSNIVEVAVMMNEFPSNMLLSKVLEDGMISQNYFLELAFRLSKFHLNLKPYNDSNDLSGNFHVYENLRVLKNFYSDNSKLLSSILEWVKKEEKLLNKRFIARKKLGCIRECHGDLHCENIYLKDNSHLEVFDAIDFNKSLRCIDPISEIAFLTTDLEVRNKSSEAIVFLNKWLEQTGDYSGLDLWRWYSSYRALVRAKVNAIKLSQIVINKTKENIDSKNRVISKINKYTNKALEIQSKSNGCLIIMHGLSGSGKSYISKFISNNLPAILIRSDIERKRFCIDRKSKIKASKNCRLIEKSHSAKFFRGDPYNHEVSKWLFHKWIPKISASALATGYITIVDATYLKREERDLMNKVATNMGSSFHIIECICNEINARKRLKRRAIDGNDASDANYEVREKQKKYLQPLSEVEKQKSLKFDESKSLNQIINEINTFIKPNNMHS